MKNALLLFVFFACMLLSCTDNQGAAPVIVIDSIYVDNTKWEIIESNPIDKNSKIDAFITLIAEQGTELFTFNVVSGYTEGDANVLYRTPYLATGISEKIEEDVQINLSSGDTTLVFKDNINGTKVTVTGKLSFPDNTDIKNIQILLNLNTNDAGAIERLNFDFREKEENNKRQ